ncbi:MAG: SRPBCC domain-containing protein [Pseudomonadota bacterium]
MTNDIEWVRIEKRFDAPIETVWMMWAEAEHFASWYGPNGARVDIKAIDATVGGARHFSMTMETPDRTMTMWFVGEFKEVTPPNRLVYTESLSDEQGNIVQPKSMGMPADHPEVTEVIVQLSDSNGGTVMTMTHVGVPAQSGGAGGWAQAFDKLAEALA